MTEPLVNAAFIPESGRAALRDPLSLTGLFAANDALGRLRAQPYLSRPASPPLLRLLPLAGFSWAGPRGLPRTRGDHALVWITEGTASLRLPRSTETACAGSLRFLPAGTAFTLTPAEGARGLVLLLSRDLAPTARPPMPQAPIFAQLDAEDAIALHADLSALMAEALRPDPQARRAFAQRLGLLNLRLARMTEAPAAPELPMPAQAAPLAERYLALALRELTTGRTIPEMAETLGTTAAALDRACRERDGRSALETLAALRVERACDLLRATPRSFEQIARESGFASRAHLSRALIAATGKPPEALRAG